MCNKYYVCNKYYFLYFKFFNLTAAYNYLFLASIRSKMGAALIIPLVIVGTVTILATIISVGIAVNDNSRVPKHRG